MKFLKIIADLSFPRILVLSVLAGVAYYFVYFDDGSQIQTQVESVNNSITEETTRRAGIEKTMKKEEEMRGNLLQLARNLDIVKSKIPTEFKDTQMSAIINNASVASGVNVLELTTTGKFGDQPKVAPKDKSAIRPEDLIEEVKFNITVSGSYDAFIKFLDVLTKEEKVIKIRNFSIEKNSAANIDDDSIRFKGEVVGFKQVAFQGAAAPSPSAPGTK